MPEAGVFGFQVAYTDPRVPSPTVGNASGASQAVPAAEKWDVVVMRVLHPDIELPRLPEQEQMKPVRTVTPIS
jgi:hypothetical protein